MIARAHQLLLFFMLFGCVLYAQTGLNFKAPQIQGNFQLDAQYYNEDSLIGALPVPEKVLSNGFMNLNFNFGKISAGTRFESYQNALQGFPLGYRGTGFPYRFVSFTDNNISVTAGSFYEQFGSGMVLRAYEERNLGYDNAFDGFRVKYKAAPGVYFKGLIGKQRKYFEKGEGIVRGIDGEINLNEITDSLKKSKLKISVGGSFVSKFQVDQSSLYDLPENVGSWAARAALRYNTISLDGEYVYKINDPSSDNAYIYKPGNGILVNLSYSKKGLGIFLSAKRIDNMSFRSDRDAALNDLQINFLPPTTKQHTYNLLGTLYPYATQANGEFGLRGSVLYKVEKGTLLGGKYGANVSINASSIHNIDTIKLNDLETKRMAYTSNFFGWGREYFHDYNIEVNKKFSSKVKGIFTYANIAYQKDIIEGKFTYGMVHADVAIVDITTKIKKRHAIRTELEALFTQQDAGHWATLIVEYTYRPKWFVAIMDQYNYGNSDKKKQLHYYSASAGYTKEATRITLSYGRQRAGIFCVGGVCRNVPASNGVLLTLTSRF